MNAQQIVSDHKKFQDENSRQLNQCVVNYSILSGDHNHVVGMTSGILATAYSPTEMEKRNQTLYTFDRTEQAMRQLAPSLLESIPGVGVVPTTTNPVRSETADISEKFIEYHRDRVWDVERLMAFDMLPNGYPGGACYVLMYPKMVGVKKVAYKNGEPYLFHEINGIETQVIINSDDSVTVGGETKTAEEMGLEVKSRNEVLMDLKVLSVFDVSVQGKISRSMRDCISVTVRCVKTIGELVTMYPKAEGKIRKLAEAMPERQSAPPYDGIDEWLSKADFKKPQYGELENDNRLLSVYQRFYNPCAMYPSGAVLTIVSHNENAEFIDETLELPWKHHKTRKGLIPIAWFPFSLNKTNSPIPFSDVQKAEGAQRTWDRVLNSVMVGVTYKAAPPIFYEKGTQFSSDAGEWFDVPTYPTNGKMVGYSAPIGRQDYKPPYTDPNLGGIIDPQMMTLIERQLNISLGLGTQMENLPKTVSGESFQAQWTADQRDLLPLQKAHQSAWFELYELLIGAASTEYYEGQPFIVLEKDQHSIIEFKKEIFGDDHDYILVSKINKPVTRKARIDILNAVVELYAKLGQIPPEQAQQLGLHRLIEALDIEEMGLLENELHPSLVKARWELAQMLSDKDVPPPLKEDFHEIHAATDLAEIQSVRFLSYAPGIKKKLLEHNHLHMLEIDTMNKLKQRELQQQAMAQEVGRQQLQMQNQPTPGEPVQEPTPQQI